MSERKPTILEMVIAETVARDAAAPEQKAPPEPDRPRKQRSWRNAAELLAGKGGRISNKVDVETGGAREVDPEDERRKP